LLFLGIGILGLIILGTTVLEEVREIINVGRVEESREEEIAEQVLNFAAMSDVHSDIESLKRALEIAKGEEVDFIIITGDLTSLGKRDELLEAKKVLDQSSFKYYSIPGNHDLWWSQKFNEDVFGEVFGQHFQSFKDKGVKFILVDNGSYLGVDEKQMEWIENEVVECAQITCLVFMHMPLNHPSSVHIMGEDSPEVASQAAELVKLLVENKVKELFAGHLHFSSEYELQGLQTTVVGALTRARNPQSPKFLEVWKGEELEKKEVFLSDYTP